MSGEGNESDTLGSTVMVGQQLNLLNLTKLSEEFPKVVLISRPRKVTNKEFSSFILSLRGRGRSRGCDKSFVRSFPLQPSHFAR